MNIGQKEEWLDEGNRWTFFHGGSGKELLVFIHGFCLNSSVWKNQLEKLGQHYRWICVELPGHGVNAGKPLTEFSLRQYGLMLSRWWKSGQFPKAHVFGHSLGGYLALEWLSIDPGQICSIGLVHSHCFGDDKEKRDERKKAAAFVKKHTLNHFLNPAIGNLFADTSSQSKENYCKDLVNAAEKMDPKVLAFYLMAMAGREDRSDLLKSTAIPWYFQLGDKDTTLPLNRQVEMLKGCSLSMAGLIPGCGHIGMLESPEKCTTYLIDFLKFTHYYA